MTDFNLEFILKIEFYFLGKTKIYQAVFYYGLGKQIFFSRFLKSLIEVMGNN